MQISEGCLILDMQERRDDASDVVKQGHGMSFGGDR